MGAGSTAFIVFPLLISGYLFNLIFYPFRYFGDRAEGQKLFFMAAGSGFILGAFVFLLAGVLKKIPGFTETDLYDAVVFINSTVPVPYASRLFLLLFCSIAIPIILNFLIEIFTRARLIISSPLLGEERKMPSGAKIIYGKLIERFGSPMSQLFRKAAEEQKTVMVTLSSRKIYCGRILETPPNLETEDACIEVLPAFSTYREKDTLRMGREKTYYKVIALWEARRYLSSRKKMKEKLESNLRILNGSLITEGLKEALLKEIDRDIEYASSQVDEVDGIDAPHVDIDDWIKVIPVREIESASFYDAKLYDRWFSQPQPSEETHKPAKSQEEREA